MPQILGMSVSFRMTENNRFDVYSLKSGKEAYLGEVFKDKGLWWNSKDQGKKGYDTRNEAAEGLIEKLIGISSGKEKDDMAGKTTTTASPKVKVATNGKKEVKKAKIEEEEIEDEEDEEEGDEDEEEFSWELEYDEDTKEGVIRFSGEPRLSKSGKMLLILSSEGWKGTGVTMTYKKKKREIQASFNFGIHVNNKKG